MALAEDCAVRKAGTTQELHFSLTKCSRQECTQMDCLADKWKFVPCKINTEKVETNGSRKGTVDKHYQGTDTVAVTKTGIY